MKKKNMLTATLILPLFCTNGIAQSASSTDYIHHGGEYILYNTYYARTLGCNEAGDSPALSTFKTNDSISYVFVAEASSLHSGYYWLRNKSNGKYLQASNATGNTWSVWFAGSLNKSYNSYEWGLESGTEGYVTSNRGMQINSSGNYRLAPDPDKESQTYINVYYDKPVSDRTVWQILDASMPLDSARLSLYVSELEEAITLGEDVYGNSAFGEESEKGELATALYNARSAKNAASIELLDSMATARKALEAAISNAQEGNYTIWVSGSSFTTGSAYTIAVKGLKTDGEATMVVRGTDGTGAVVKLNDTGIKIGDKSFEYGDTAQAAHDIQLAFDGTLVHLYINGEEAGTSDQKSVPVMTSVGKSAEWTVLGDKALTSYCPEIISTDKALSPSEKNVNSHDKEELNALMMNGYELTLDRAIDYHINGSTAMTGSKIDIEDEDAWIIFDNVRPSDVISKYLSSITINGKKASNGSNCRVAIYLQGAALIPHKSAYKPFYGYTGQAYAGDEYNFGVGKATLGDAANELQSFILKRGYMVTLATNSDGSGYSRVYVADHEDKQIDNLPDLLRHRISYINVRRWNYVSKKGWCTTESTSATNTVNKLLGFTWYYTWSADRTTQTDMEYVPQKGHLYWPSWSDINNVSNATAVLGLNEPEHSEQHTSSTCSCGGTINSWTACTKTPDFQASGLRIGSPSPTDASWLKEYIGHCDDMAYRVDFVGFHAYWGTNEAANAASWKSQLQSIYNNTKRPIWLTEWNNGASWTTESWPSSYGDKLSKQREAIKNILEVLDNSDFIERYAIYNWDSYYRAVITWDSDKNNWWVTPAGQVYRDARPTHAYNEKMQFVPIGWFPSMKTNNTLECTLTAATNKVKLAITNPNGDFTKEEVVEYLTPSGTYEPFYTTAKRSSFDTTSQRATTITKDECTLGAFDGEQLTLRLKITTLKDGVTYTDPIVVDIPETMRNGYDGIQSIDGSGNAVSVQASSDGLTITTGKPTQVKIYTANGTLIKSANCDGTTLIPLPQGVYIVNGKSFVVAQ